MRKTPFVVLVLLLAVTLLAALPATAQDGLPDDQQAALDRAIAALEQTRAEDRYTARVQDYIAIQTQQIGAESILSRNDVTNRRYTEQYLREGVIENIARENIARAYTVEQTLLDYDGSQSALEITADTRLVAGDLAVRAAYVTAPDDAPALPAEWVLVTPETLEAFPGLEPLALTHDLWAIDAGTNALITPDTLRILGEYAIWVEAHPLTLEDDTALDAVDITISGAGIRDLLLLTADLDDPATRALFDALEPVDGLVTVGIAENGHAVYLDWFIPFNYFDLDPRAVALEPAEGLTVERFGMQNRIVRFTSFEEPEEPVELPAELSDSGG